MDDDIRRELDQLRETDRDLRHSIENLDNHGSRGVLQLQAQVTELIKDISGLRTAIVAHDTQHVTERQERAKTRRWLITTIITTAGAIGGLYAMLFDVMTHVHGL